MNRKELIEVAAGVGVAIASGGFLDLLVQIIDYFSKKVPGVVVPPTDGDERPPTELGQSGPLEIKEPAKKNFEPATFVLRKDLEVEQRDIMDEKTPTIVKKKNKKSAEPDPNAPALPAKRRGRPRKPAFIAKDAQENLPDENGT